MPNGDLLKQWGGVEGMMEGQERGVLVVGNTLFKAKIPNAGHALLRLVATLECFSERDPLQ